MRDLIWEVMVQVWITRFGRIKQHVETPKRVGIATTISRTEGRGSELGGFVFKRDHWWEVGPGEIFSISWN